MTIAHRFVHLCILLLASAFLAGCSKEGPVEETEEESFVQNRLSFGLPVYEDIIEPLIASFSEDGTTNNAVLALFSIDPTTLGSFEDASKVILEAGDNKVLALNTQADIEGRDEITIAVSEDTVYKIEHATGEIRLLRHFNQKVCEVLPSEVVVEATDGSFNVLHEEVVYVVVAIGGETDSDCAATDADKLYFELALNYQFDADELDEEYTNVLPVVTESQARAKLVLGLVDDPASSDPDDQILDYGYLGFDTEDQKLRFYDSDRLALWEQDRMLEEFDVASLRAGDSSNYVFEMKELSYFHYWVQMGRDVFIVDSSNELFQWDTSDVQSIMDDRIYRAAYIDGLDAGVNAIEALKPIDDEQNVIFLDDGKFFRLDYVAGKTLPTMPVIKPLNPISLDDISYEATYSFSQFDIQSCDDFDDVAACNDANTADPILNPTWQFITDCDLALGCALDTTVDDFCTLFEDRTGDPDEVICTTADYTHIGELNETANDAEFRGYLQYNSDYIRSMEMQLYEDSLLITARMTAHDILVRYFYNVDITDVKINRERVIFGERLEHHGLDAYVSRDNLFVTSLRFANQETINECYKNYKEVACNDRVCADFDAELGETGCINGFKSYESHAMFCTNDQVNNGLCSDDEITGGDTLSVEADDEDAKWVRMTDYINAVDGVPQPDMFLLIGDESLVEDEGILVNPVLVNLDDDTGGNPIAVAEIDRVETVTDTGVVYNGVVGRLDLIADDVDRDQSGVKSHVDMYFLNNPNDSSQSSAAKAGELDFTSIHRF